MKQIVVTLRPGHALGETIVAQGLTLHAEGVSRFVWAAEIESIGGTFPTREGAGPTPAPQPPPPPPLPPPAPDPKPAPKKGGKR